MHSRFRVEWLIRDGLIQIGDGRTRDGLCRTGHFEACLLLSDISGQIRN